MGCFTKDNCFDDDKKQNQKKNFKKFNSFEFSKNVF